MPTKSIFLSKTFWGSVIALVAVTFPAFWMTLGFGGDYAALADKVLGGIAFILTVYGRFHATEAVTVTGTPATK